MYSTQRKTEYYNISNIGPLGRPTKKKPTKNQQKNPTTNQTYKTTTTNQTYKTTTTNLLLDWF